MKEYLERCRRSLREDAQNDEVFWTLVLGNKKCTMDGTVAAFSFACCTQVLGVQDRELCMPVVNISRSLLHTKGDLLQHFLKLNISPELLICVDEIDADSCAVFILFDNQSEPFGPTLDVRWTVLVFDHRPGHMHLQFPSYCLEEFKEAGCISTVVALYLLRFCDENLTDDMKVAFFMLYEAILYATDNLTEALDSDLAAVEKLEGWLGVPEPDYAENLIAILNVAHCNDLHAYQLLRDHVHNTMDESGVTICYVAMPMSLFAFKKKNTADVKRSLRAMAETHKYEMIVLSGEYLDEYECKIYDMAVVHTGRADLVLYTKTVAFLEKELRLVVRDTLSRPESVWFKPKRNLSVDRLQAILRYIK